MELMTTSMLDLLPSEMWVVHPSPRFLEPACGDGNFLVAILARKLEHIGTEALHTDSRKACSEPLFHIDHHR